MGAVAQGEPGGQLVCCAPAAAVASAVEKSNAHIILSSFSWFGSLFREVLSTALEKGMQHRQLGISPVSASAESE